MRWALCIFFLTVIVFVESITFAKPAKPSGLMGGCYERLSDGRVGKQIPGVRIAYVSEDGSWSKTVDAGQGGRYRVALPKGRYKVIALAPGYKPYKTGQGFSVVTGDKGYQTSNIFLHRQEE